MIPTRKQLASMSNRDFTKLLDRIRDEVDARKNFYSTTLKALDATEVRHFLLVIGQIEVGSEDGISDPREKVLRHIRKHYNIPKATFFMPRLSERKDYAAYLH